MCLTTSPIEYRLQEINKIKIKHDSFDALKSTKFYNYIPRRKSGIYWIQVRRAAAAAAAVEISLWTR